MTEYPHWTKRTIHGWAWYRRIGYLFAQIVRRLAGQDDGRN